MKFWVFLVALFFTATGTFAQAPHPRDSIILESKVVMPGGAAGATADTGTYLRVRVWITNKDTLSVVTLPVAIRSPSGGAFITGGWPRNFGGNASRLTSTLGATTVFAPRMNGITPDTATFAGFYDPSEPTTWEPPNATRKPLWDLKFDTVQAALGMVEIDTIKVLATSAGFVDVSMPIPNSVLINFRKSVITVTGKGDFNGDGTLTAADLMAHLNCVFLGLPPPSGPGSCDLNCDGTATSLDVVLLLNAIFFGALFPC